MTLNNTTIGAIAFGCAGVAAGIVSLFVAHDAKKKSEEGKQELTKVANKLGKTIEDLTDGTEVEISDSIVKKAVDEAVKREANEQVKAATQRAIIEVKLDISSRIKEEVDNAYSDLRAKVQEELDRQVSDLDIRTIKKEIVEQASRKAKYEFDDKLKEVLDRLDDKEDELDDRVKEIEDDYKGKLDDKMDDILDRLNSQIKDAKRIYSSVASALGDK